MRHETEQAMEKARAECAKLPLIARAFAGAVMAVLESMNRELGAKRGD